MKLETSMLFSDRLELTTQDLFRLLAGDTLESAALDVVCSDAIPGPKNTAILRVCRGIANGPITEAEAETMLRAIGRFI